MTDLKLFNQLPKDGKDAVNHIIEEVLGDESPDMKDAFRVWQAELFRSGILEKDREDDLLLFEIEALAFRGGWARREQRE